MRITCAGRSRNDSASVSAVLRCRRMAPSLDASMSLRRYYRHFSSISPRISNESHRHMATIADGDVPHFLALLSHFRHAQDAGVALRDKSLARDFSPKYHDLMPRIFAICAGDDSHRFAARMLSSACTHAIALRIRFRALPISLAALTSRELRLCVICLATFRPGYIAHALREKDRFAAPAKQKPILSVP